MEFELTGGQRLIQDTVRALVEDRILPAVARIGIAAPVHARR
jgi:hypothetical protein